MPNEGFYFKGSVGKSSNDILVSYVQDILAEGYKMRGCKGGHRELYQINYGKWVLAYFPEPVGISFSEKEEKSARRKIKTEFFDCANVARKRVSELSRKGVDKEHYLLHKINGLELILTNSHKLQLERAERWFEESKKTNYIIGRKAG